MYVYCSCAGLLGKQTPEGRLIENDEDMAIYLLEAANVAVVQGGAYGLSPYIRASFAIETGQLQEAGQRIAAACGRLR